MQATARREDTNGTWIATVVIGNPSTVEEVRYRANGTGASPDPEGRLMYREAFPTRYLGRAATDEICLSDYAEAMLGTKIRELKRLQADVLPSRAAV